ncbi:MFS transporter [Blastococcus sp. SYSU D00922]
MAAVLLVALNLRGAIAAVGPVLPELRRDLALSATTAGLLTALPVLCFAALAPAAARVGRRVGTRAALLGSLVALAVGTALRVLDGAPVLLAGTFVVGAAMTVGNVLLPVVVKGGFGPRAGAVTGLYTAALAAGAALTAALSAPVADLGGWRLGLAVWAPLPLVAAVVWVGVGWTAPTGTTQRHDAPGASGASPVRVWRAPVAWAVSVVLALQSALYYALTTWLPSLLTEDLRLTAGTAAVAASVFQVLGIPGAMAVPALLGRWGSQVRLAIAVAIGWALVPAGLLLWPEAWPAWVVIGGLAQGAGISLAFALVVLRSADDEVVRRVSGMSQLVGYSVGAAAPLAVGGLYAVTGGWGAPLLLLLGAAAALGVVGSVAGRPAVLGGARAAQP